MPKGFPDLILFFVLTGVPIAAFLLQNYPNSLFYAVLVVVFLVLLVWMREYKDQGAFRQFLVYDANLDFEGLLWILGGIVAVYMAASVIVSSLVVSSIYVPMSQSVTVSFGQLQLSPVWNGVLFNICMVGPGEELIKLVLALALFMEFKDLISVGFARVVAIIVPVGAWALLHAYVAYTGPNMPILIFSAFVGGLIIFSVMWKTSSLVAAILVHAGYNSIIVILSQSSLKAASLGPAGMALLLAIVTPVILSIGVYKKFFLCR